MSKMAVCPRCDGKGELVFTSSYCWDEPIEGECYECPECGGEGVISKVRDACNKARGGFAKTKLRDYA